MANSFSDFFYNNGNLSITGPASIITGSPKVDWPGGQGTFAISAVNWGGATLKLMVLLPDNNTWVSVGPDTTKTANGIGNFALAPCRLGIGMDVPSGVTVNILLIYASVARVIF